LFNVTKEEYDSEPFRYSLNIKQIYKHKEFDVYFYKYPYELVMYPIIKINCSICNTVYYGTNISKTCSLECVIKLRTNSNRSNRQSLKKDSKNYNSIVKHIDHRENRHVKYAEVYSSLAKRFRDILPGGLNGKVITLPGDAAHLDTIRLQTHFQGIDEFIWYEKRKDTLSRLELFKEQFNKGLIGFAKFLIKPSNILRSRNTNVALANIDLECTMNMDLINNLKHLIKKGLKGRQYMGIVLNISTRGPAGMSMELRKTMWNDLIHKFGVVYNHTPLNYNSGTRGNNMLLFGAILKDKTYGKKT